MSAENNLKQKNIVLPNPPKPVGNYVRTVRTGNLLYTAGSGPGPTSPRGKVGRDLTVEQGYQAAREVGLNLLAVVRENLGSLDKVKHVVKVLGMVNSAEGAARIIACSPSPRSAPRRSPASPCCPSRSGARPCRPAP